MEKVFYYNGDVYTCKKIAQILGVGTETIRIRFRRGMSIEEVFRAGKRKQIPIKNITIGQRFGRLVVKSRLPNKNKSPRLLCLCDCGNEVAVRPDQLKSGKTKSCGCYNKERVIETHTTHKGSHDRLYKKWSSMKNRCNNPRYKQYGDYGGRGIKVCQEWYDYGVFREWCLSHGYTIGLQLDRIDNNKGYEPDNCRFISRVENMNNRRGCVKVSYNGETLTIAQWAKRYNIPQGTLHSRYFQLKWDFHRALTEEVKRPKNDQDK